MSSLILVRQIAARPSIVFAALTTVEGVASWWGPDELPVLKASVEARVGGAFMVRFQTSDGLEHETCGEFLEIDPPRRLVMTYRYAFGGEPEEDGRTSKIEIDLKVISSGVELTFTQSELANPLSVESHRRGWTGAFAKLTRILGQAAEPQKETSE